MYVYCAKHRVSARTLGEINLRYKLFYIIYLYDNIDMDLLP